MVTLKSLLM